MPFDLEKIAAAAADTILPIRKRQKRELVNEIITAHPSLRAKITMIYGNQNLGSYDKRRAAEDAVREFDENNGKQISSAGLLPSEIVRYSKDRVNAHLAAAGYSIRHDRVSAVLLAHNKEEQE